jgi:hypothetical protein
LEKNLTGLLIETPRRMCKTTLNDKNSLIPRDMAPHRDAMQWALDKYAEKSAAGLELLSTIVNANREGSPAHGQMAFAELSRKV